MGCAKQDEFTANIREFDAAGGGDTNSVFAFWRRPLTKNKLVHSSTSQLSSRQQDVLYALAGCSDVHYDEASVSIQVRNISCHACMHGHMACLQDTVPKGGLRVFLSLPGI